MNAHEAVHDAICEAELYGTVNFTEALGFVPDEFHTKHFSLRERFVASVAANAQNARRNPYTVACYALDI